MPAASRSRNGLKPVAAVLFPVSLVLAVMALDEPTAAAIWSRASDAASGVWSMARAQWGRLAPAETAVAPAYDGPVLQGVFHAADESTRTVTGDVDFVRAELRFAGAGLLKTRPHRIAFGREANFATLYGAGPDDQIELRQVLAGSTAGLCDGTAPGWIGLRHEGERVTLIAFRDGPAPGAAASPEAPCAVLTYRR